MQRSLEIRFDDDDCYVRAITKRGAGLLVKRFFQLDIGQEKPAGRKRPGPVLMH